MIKGIKLLLAIFLFFQIEYTMGQTRYTLTADKIYVNGLDPLYKAVKPGDTLAFLSGNKDYLLIANFRGAPGNPIVIINSGGPIIIDTDHYYGIAIKNCQYIKFTGTGDPSQMYGFQIKRVANGGGMGVGELSSDFEIDHVSIENTLIGGLYAKTDPDCSLTSVRSAFTQYNTIIHDNYIGYAGNEGMYIGSTKWDGQTVNCNGKDTLLMPSLLDGVQVYNNIVKYAGWDGIQVSSAYKNCKIYNNTVLYDSQAQAYAQMSGIILGGGTKGDCYNNFISQGKGDGIECHGLSGSRIFNNIILDAGRTDLGTTFADMKFGIYVSDNDSAIDIQNNNIINPKSEGIRFANVFGKDNVIASNIIINPGNFDLYENGNSHFKGIDSYINFQDLGTVATIQNNYFARNTDLVKFASSTLQNPEDLKLLAGSPLIDQADIDAHVNFDFGGAPRPFGVKSDIGAFEFGSEIVVNPGPKIQNITGGGISCVGGAGLEVGLSGTETGVSYSLLLNGSNTGNSVAGTGSAISFGLQTVAGTYSATGTEVSSSLTNAMAGSVAVTIDNLPTVPDAIGGANSVCLGNSTVLTNATTGGVWSSLTPAVATVTAAGVVAGVSEGPATILYTVTNGSGCTNSATASITVNALPTLFPVTGGGVYCTGGAGVAVGLSGSQIGVNYQLVLNGSISGSPIAGTGNAISFGLKTTAGNYSVVGINTTNTCSITMTGNVAITVSALPAAPASIGGTKTVCVGSTTTLTDATSGGVWSSSNTSTASVSSSGVVTGLSAGTATIRYTITNSGGCSSSVSTSVTVNASPITYTVTGGGSYCTGGTGVAVGLSDTQSGINYQLLLNGINLGAAIAGTGNAISFGLKTQAGIYTVFAKYSTTGCATTMNGSVTVTLNSIPTAPDSIGGIKSVCKGGSTTLTDATTGGVWSSLNTSIATVNANTGVVNGVSAGTATIKYTVTNAGGCSNSTSTSVTVNSPPSQPTKFTTSKSRVTLGSSNVVYTVPNVAGVTYKWSYSGTGATITGTTNSVLISFSLTAKSGTLSVTATNGCGTSAARSMTITLVKGAVIPSDTINQAAAKIPVTLLEITPENNQLKIYPNPTLGQANFDFQISTDAHVTLDIVSMSGHQIARIYDADLVAGILQTVLLQQTLPTGVYFCVMRWNGKMITEKLVIMK
jgi:uncharacterized protein YjdB